MIRALVLALLALLLAGAASADGYDDAACPATACVLPLAAAEAYFDSTYRLPVSSYADHCAGQCRLYASACKKVVRSAARCGKSELSAYWKSVQLLCVNVRGGVFDHDDTGCLAWAKAEGKSVLAALKENASAALGICTEETEECQGACERGGY
jgi:hypothetical protein